jgi:hypothetical protein
VPDTSPSPADWLLALIPLPLVLGTVAGVASSLSLATAIGAGSLPASGLVGYALFCTSVAE